MKKKEPIMEVVALVIILALILLSMYYNSKTLGTPLNETPILTYYKPLGGEERRIQEVYLACTTGASKGVTGGKEWCQEIVIREWTE